SRFLMFLKFHKEHVVLPVGGNDRLITSKDCWERRRSGRFPFVGPIAIRGGLVIMAGLPSPRLLGSLELL
ncbi:MAG: hypothetical protein KDA66_11825, partial [Planctomycetaceae bacterium]|nr:hypothetical protein [Planctomycetaceae bacterium]